MARYTLSKTKLSRRVSRNLYLKGSRSFSSKDDYTKRVAKQFTMRNKRPKSLSEFGRQLLEKQALKFTYGLQEKQLANIFSKAFRQTGDTGLTALTALEKRLDNVVYRAGLANSRNQARQLVSHGHFEVDGHKVNIPSYQVKAGNLISVRKTKSDSVFWKNFQLEIPNDVPTWLDATNKHQIKVLNLPIESDLPKDFNIPSVVEYYSRKVS